MLRLRCLRLLLLLALLALLPGAALAQEAWTADEVMSRSLDQEVLLGDAALRPPRGYELESASEEKDGLRLSSVTWSGPRRADLTAAVFQVNVIAPLAGAEPSVPTWASLENAVLQMTAGEKRIHSGFERSKLERGTINGVRFVRTRWSGVQLRSGNRIKGFTYCAEVGGLLFTLVARDTQPHDKQSAALAEAAVMSFRAEPPRAK